MNTYKSVRHGDAWGVAENGVLLAIGLPKLRAGDLVKALRDEQRQKHPMTAILRCDFPRYGRAPVYDHDPDPILDLWRVRAIAIERPDDRRAQIAYGETKQRVVSPVGPLP